MRSFQRERRAVCGRTKRTAKYQEIEIFPMVGTGEQWERCKEYDGEVARNPRSPTPETMAKHNATVARRHFVQIMNTNFSEADTHTTLTYSDETLPQTMEQAERDYGNYLRHLRDACAARQLPRPEALAVMEWQDADKEAGQKAVRYHFHVLLRCKLDRDTIEACWHRKGQRLGRANSDRLQMDKNSLEALANYLLKYTNRKHRWKRTRGIADPIKPEPNDNKYTRRQVEKIATDSALLHSPEFWARKYQGWLLNEASARYNEFTGWYISLKMRKKEGRGRGD